MALTFGQGLYVWRSFRGYNQEELAALADVSNDTISRHERPPGDDTPDYGVSAKIKRKLAAALNIKPEDFHTYPTQLPEQEKSLEDIFDEVRSLYGSGKYTKEEIQREAHLFLSEILAEEKKESEQGN